MKKLKIDTVVVNLEEGDKAQEKMNDLLTKNYKIEHSFGKRNENLLLIKRVQITEEEVEEDED